jgi:predicted RNA-binding protein YlxR (DUF448 family)
MRSVPVRICVGCRRRDAQPNLVRLVLDRAAIPPRVVVDRRANLAGRGAYLHRDQRCVERAIRRGALARAFRLKGAVETRALEGLGTTDRANPSEAGGKSDGHTMSAQK